MALSRVIVDEWRLLNLWIGGNTNARPVSERAVAFQLGWYLRPLIERSWDLDCEYNREGVADAAAIKRADESARLPDLIIHRRGMSMEENNLLVLELKTNHEIQGDGGGGLESVRALMRRHKYRYGVLLDLRIFQGSLRPRWEWLDGGTAGCHAVPEKEAVYSDGDLNALIARAREEERRRYPVRRSVNSVERTPIALLRRAVVLVLNPRGRELGALSGQEAGQRQGPVDPAD